MSSSPTGTFYGIGVGPGDPELLTRKAVRILGEVQSIYTPVAVSRESSLAARIVASLGLPADRMCPVLLTMARNREADERTYQAAAQAILEQLRAGSSVAWITEGDPLLYSTFLPIFELIRQEDAIRIEIVPGITSCQAAAARAGVPIATREQQAAIVPAAYGVEHLPELVERFATVFLLKVSPVLDTLLDRLARLPVRTWYAEKVGHAGERILTEVQELRGQSVPYFSLLIVQRKERP